MAPRKDPGCFHNFGDFAITIPLPIDILDEMNYNGMYKSLRQRFQLSAQADGEIRIEAVRIAGTKPAQRSNEFGISGFSVSAFSRYSRCCSGKS